MLVRRKLHGGAISQHLGRTLGELGRVVTHGDHGVGSSFLGVLHHAFVRFLSGRFAYIGKRFDCDFRFYLVNGTKLEPVPDLVAICFSCNRFVLSEFVRTRSQCVDEMRWLRSLTGDDRVRAELVHGSLEAVARRCCGEARLRRGRVSPPRCLECGAPNIVQERVNDHGHSTGKLVHPGYSPNELLVECDGHASTKSGHRLYDCEGNEIRLPYETVIDIVKRCRGKPEIGILRDGRIFYGDTFGYGGRVLDNPWNRRAT